MAEDAREEQRLWGVGSAHEMQSKGKAKDLLGSLCSATREKVK